MQFEGVDNNHRTGLLTVLIPPIEAMAWYRQARAHNPEEALNYVRLAVLLRKQPEVDGQLRERNLIRPIGQRQ